MEHRRLHSRHGRWITITICVGGLIPAPPALAQPAATPLTLAAAIEQARANYPALKEARARANAASATVGVAKTAYLPRLDMLWQINRATHNNVFGLLLSQPVVPPISGPVLGTSGFDSVWGTAGGVLLSWQAVDFGLRRATVAAARAQSDAVAAQAALTELDASAAAADAFLTVLAADEAVRASRANVDRLQTFADSVRTLVRNQLRPGADESRADAELAVAKNQLAQAQQASAVARASLAETIGRADATLTLDSAGLGRPPQLPGSGGSSVELHPAVRAASAAVATVQARERAISRSYAPRIDFQSAFSGRGSGAAVPGLPDPGSGLALQTPNWAVGLTVSFSALDVFAVNARAKVEAQNGLAELARQEQALQHVAAQQARARALLDSATAIAVNTPAELKAAADADSRARARYSSGLANVTEVAEAARLLAQAEADDAMARLGVWRALLAVSQAGGDLRPFLDQLRRP